MYLFRKIEHVEVQVVIIEVDQLQLLLSKADQAFLSPWHKPGGAVDTKPLSACVPDCRERPAQSEMVEVIPSSIEFRDVIKEKVYYCQLTVKNRSSCLRKIRIRAPSSEVFLATETILCQRGLSVPCTSSAMTIT